MRKFATLALLSFVLYSIFSQVGAAPSGGVGGDNSSGELVDIKANLVYPYKVNDTLSVLCLVGEFAAQHNGAVITADSAVRYEDERIECFGDVLINKNTTYAYCDHADYDSQNNLVSLYSPLVKVVDEDVTLYTYNFVFNTLDNVGRYWGGGVTMRYIPPTVEPEAGFVPEYDIMESVKGYYYADLKSVIGVDDVELKGEGYQLKGDSVIYDMDLHNATFFGPTNIWGEGGEFVYGDEGVYVRDEELYSVTKNGYILTEDNEAWGDSMEYYRMKEEAIFRNNIQILDTVNKSIAFGDYAQYWGDVEQVLLTRDPLVINYDTQQEGQAVDSLYFRGDTLEMYSYVVGTGPFSDSLSLVKNEVEIPEGFSDMMAEDVEPVEGVEEHDHDHHDHDHEHDHAVVDSLATDSIAIANIPSKRELKELARETKAAAKVTAFEAREYRKLEERRDKLVARVEKKRSKNRSAYSDSMSLLRVLAEITAYNGGKADSLDSLAVVDSVDSVAEEIVKNDSLPERDSLYRVFIGYGDVRAYRSDFQMVCDSMVANSFDTIMSLYIKPIFWSDKNQVTAESMDFYTRDGELDYGDFIGNPIMASLVEPQDTIHINQVVGKTMRATFENNNVTRNDVDGNVQTIYYMQDDESGEANTIAYIQSGSASFMIKEQQLDGVVYRQSPTYTFSPLDIIPSDVPMYLDGFSWEEGRRPTLSSIMNRTIRPSKREEMSRVDRPTFPILKDIDKARMELVEQEEWSDRIDMVSPEATEWMQSLGFTPGEPRPEGSSPF